MKCSIFLAVMLSAVIVLAAEELHSGSDGADRRSVAALLEQRLAENSADLQRKKESAAATLIAARQKVHDDQMKRHRLIDPDEHAIITDEVRHKFLISRRNLLVEQTPQSVLQTALLIVIATFPLAILVVWLRS